MFPLSSWLWSPTIMTHDCLRVQMWQSWTLGFVKVERGTSEMLPALRMPSSAERTCEKRSGPRMTKQLQRFNCNPQSHQMPFTTPENCPKFLNSTGLLGHIQLAPTVLLQANLAMDWNSVFELKGPPQQVIKKHLEVWASRLLDQFWRLGDLLK